MDFLYDIRQDIFIFDREKFLSIYKNQEWKFAMFVWYEFKSV